MLIRMTDAKGKGMKGMYTDAADEKTWFGVDVIPGDNRMFLIYQPAVS